MNIKGELEKKIGVSEKLYLNDVQIDPFMIKTIMINEVVPSDPGQDFYGCSDSDYLSTAIPLFQKAGVPVTSIQEILQKGIYITNAVKIPKSAYEIEKSAIEESLPCLEAEIDLFPNVRVIMLMGDVAKKMFNIIAKKRTGKNVLPPVSTYKLRGSQIYDGSVRVMPSYIMTGKNILIEKSKFQMASEDIATMMKIIGY